MPRGTNNWVEFCVNLRKRMFQEEWFEITLSVEEIHGQSGTDVSLAELRNPGSWNPCRDAKPDFNTAQKNGLNIDFDVEADGKVQFVTFSLDEARRVIHCEAARR